jgi:chromosome segregation ATPase
MDLIELHEEAVNAAEVARDQAEQGREKAMMAVTDMETNYTIALEQAKAAESGRDYFKCKYMQLHCAMAKLNNKFGLAMQSERHQHQETKQSAAQQLAAAERECERLRLNASELQAWAEQLEQEMQAAAAILLQVAADLGKWRTTPEAPAWLFACRSQHRPAPDGPAPPMPKSWDL